MRFPLPSLAGALLLCWPGARSQAEFMAPRMTPVDRLVKNAEAYLAKNRAEADAHYTLARIHYLAFSTQRDQVAAFTRGEIAEGKPQPVPEWMRGWTQSTEGKGPKLTQALLIEHAAKARQGFDEAVRL